MVELALVLYYPTKQKLQLCIPNGVNCTIIPNNASKMDVTKTDETIGSDFWLTICLFSSILLQYLLSFSTTTTFPPSGLFGFGSTICWSPWILGLQGLLLAVWTRNAGGGITATFQGGVPTTAAWFRKRISQCSKSLETEFTCLRLGPVLIVLELVPLTLRKLKDDNKAREIQIFCKSSRYPLTPCTPPGGGTGGFSKMARVPEVENFFEQINT